MSKKLFTFLGTNDYKPTVYYFNEESIGEEKYGDLKTQYVQLTLCKELGYDTELIVCLTQEAIDKNWMPTNGKQGLKELLSKVGINSKVVEILKGENSDELWQNFDIIFNEFEEDDEVYVDITYSLRSIPVIFMSLLNYAYTVKKINIKGIYYGAFDAGKPIKLGSEDSKLVPIFDLTFFNIIQNWSKGAEEFLTTGNSKLLSGEIRKAKNSVSKIFETDNIDKINEARLMESISRSLKSYSEDLLTCRGKNITKDCKNLKDELNKIKEITISDFTPFSKIINQISDNLKPYNGEVINDSIYAIEQSREFGLLQQAYTMLRETIVTFVTIQIGLDYNHTVNREMAEHIINDFVHGGNSNYTLSEIEMELKSKCDTKVMKKIAGIYRNIGGFRNDLDHGGFSNNATSYLKFEKKLGDFITQFKGIVDNSYKPKTEENLSKTVVSILSHKLLNSQVDELKNTWNVEKIIYLPEKLKSDWCNVNPSDDLEDDSNLLDRLREFILDNTNQEDYIIVQGEWGMTFTIVNMCFELNRVPIYATTERKTKETVKDGQVHSEKVFEHIRFRKYRI
jgi:CRISPR-associated Csx2 family protein